MTAHRVRDLTVAIALEGDFAASYVDGDNSLVVATDTMKNTAYALAAEHLTGAIETYAAALGRHFLEDPQVSTVTVSIERVRLAADRIGARRVHPRPDLDADVRRRDVAGRR